MDQMKAFFRKRIPEFSCTRKEIVDVDILTTSRNGVNFMPGIFENCNWYIKQLQSHNAALRYQA